MPNISTNIKEKEYKISFRSRNDYEISHFAEILGSYDEKLLEDLKIGKQGQHASNLGGILAKEIASEINVPSEPGLIIKILYAILNLLYINYCLRSKRKRR